jgi:hypothetical protein
MPGDIVFQLRTLPYFHACPCPRADASAAYAASVMVYSTLTVEFLYRYHTSKPMRDVQRFGDKKIIDLRVMLMLAGLAFMDLLVFIWSVPHTPPSCAHTGPPHRPY